MSRMTYRTRMRWLFALAIVGTTLVGLAVGFGAQQFGNSGERWHLFALAVLSFIAVFGLGWLWWRPLDDHQKQGHMSSWYWGGMAGGVVFLLWLVVIGARQSDYAWGAANMLFAQAAGFLLYYTYWWLRGRAGSAE